MASSVVQNLNSASLVRPQSSRSTRASASNTLQGPSLSKSAHGCTLSQRRTAQRSLQVSRKSQRSRPANRLTKLNATSESTEAETAASVDSTPSPPLEQGDFVPCLRVATLKKGYRDTVNLANGKQALIFWWKNEIVAIESRSPAEGAFSTGFMDSRLSQDECIECPATSSKFNFRTGQIMDWYPSNAVLRAITPKDTCRPMEVFKARINGEYIEVDPKNTNLSDIPEEERAKWTNATIAGTAGGSDTSLENNNVFAIEPEMYLETGEAIEDDGAGSGQKMDPATLAISTVAVAIVSIAGTATCLYYENIPALIAFWVIGFGGVGYIVYDKALKKDLEE